MVSKGKVTAKDASYTQKGVCRAATQEEVDAGIISNVFVTPETLKNFPFPIQGYIPIPLVIFNTDIVLQPNHSHALVSEEVISTVTCQLPERGTFSKSDVIECDDVSGFNFKITVTGDTLLRIDDTLISSIDGKFLISGGRGSTVKLRAINSQLWYVVRRDRVTIGIL